MVSKLVEAVAFWRYAQDNGESAFRAAYGRFIGNTYSKDYLQVSGEAQKAMERAFGTGNPQFNFEWRWPNGRLPGRWKKKVSDPRGELYIRDGSGTVEPFRLGNPLTSQVNSIPGDPNRTTPADADAELEKLKAGGCRPWLLAIKLVGETSTLHARAYLQNPPVGLEDRGLHRLPESVRQAILSLPKNVAGGGVIMESKRVRNPALVDRIKKSLAIQPNVLLTGPPGVGKTVALEDLQAEFDAPVTFDPDVTEWEWGDVASSTHRFESVVFHPSYQYENFVAGLRPKSGTGVALELAAKAGPLLSLAQWARSGDRYALLTIDEFNRGAAAAIFGDTLALLDKDKREAAFQSGAKIQRPFPEDTMSVTPEYADASGETKIPDRISLPLNLHIVAAMNSSDRSIAPLDAAMRRRFAIIHVGPDYAALAAKLSIQQPDRSQQFAAATTPLTAWTPNDTAELAVRLLMALNERILAIQGQDHLLGHSLLWNISLSSLQESLKSLAEHMDAQVINSLRHNFNDEDETLAAVLNIPGPDAPAPAKHLCGRWVNPPTSVKDFASPRLAIDSIGEMALVDDIAAVLLAILGQ